MELSEIQKALADYGYWALFVGTFLEGEIFFILGGVAAHQGLLNPWYVAATALAGGFVGDQVFFLLGRWRGAGLLARWRQLARKAVLVRRLVRRHAVAMMLLSRFLYGLRMVIPLACGAAKINPLVFLGLNLVSALVWSLVFGGLGFLFSGWVFSHLNLVQGLPALAGLVVLAVALAAVLGRMAQRRLLGQEGPEVTEGTEEG
jgi:membrane protein DedA with SNARE-associated domain